MSARARGTRNDDVDVNDIVFSPSMEEDEHSDASELVLGTPEAAAEGDSHEIHSDEDNRESGAPDSSITDQLRQKRKRGARDAVSGDDAPAEAKDGSRKRRKTHHGEAVRIPSKKTNAKRSSAAEAASGGKNKGASSVSAEAVDPRKKKSFEKQLQKFASDNKKREQTLEKLRGQAVQLGIAIPLELRTAVPSQQPESTESTTISSNKTQRQTMQDRLSDPKDIGALMQKTAWKEFVAVYKDNPIPDLVFDLLASADTRRALLHNWYEVLLPRFNDESLIPLMLRHIIDNLKDDQKKMITIGHRAAHPKNKDDILRGCARLGDFKGRISVALNITPASARMAARPPFQENNPPFMYLTKLEQWARDFGHQLDATTMAHTIEGLNHSLRAYFRPKFESWTQSFITQMRRDPTWDDFTLWFYKVVTDYANRRSSEIQAEEDRKKASPAVQPQPQSAQQSPTLTVATGVPVLTINGTSQIPAAFQMLDMASGQPVLFTANVTSAAQQQTRFGYNQAGSNNQPYRRDNQSSGGHRGGNQGYRGGRGGRGGFDGYQRGRGGLHQGRRTHGQGGAPAKAEEKLPDDPFNAVECKFCKDRGLPSFVHSENSCAVKANADKLFGSGNGK